MKALTFLFILSLPVLVYANAGGGPSGYAGDPPARSTCINCHNSFNLNDGQGGLQLSGLPQDGYLPGEEYDLTISIADSIAIRWGFMLTSLMDNNDGIGSFNVTDQQNTWLDERNGKEYLKQTRQGSFDNQAGGASWDVTWTAPQEDVGEITFYFTGNAANSNSNTTGDYIYASSVSVAAGEVVEPVEHEIPLHEGWNFISSYIIPDNPDIRDVFSDLVGRGSLLIVVNQDGAFYVPQMDFNNIPGWNSLESYKLRMTSDDMLVFSGQPINPDTTIILDNGNNWVPVTADQQANPHIAFSSIEGIENLSFWVKGPDHRFYSPELGFNGLDYIQPGSGYHIYINDDREDDSLMVHFQWNFDEHQEEPYLWQEPDHFDLTHYPTDESMSLYLEILSGTSQGDELSVYVERQDEEVVVGTGVVDETGHVPAIIWADDQRTEDVEGAQAGEDLLFKYFVQGTGVIADSVVVLTMDDERLDEVDFAANEIIPLKLDFEFPISVPDEGGDLPRRFDLHSVYPNPFNSTTKIRYSLPEANHVVFEVFDTSGRLVETLIDDNKMRGDHTIMWQADNINAGVYILKLASQTSNTQSLRKVVLVK